MRVLWITNTIFPAPSKALARPVEVSGGWMYSMAKQLSMEQGNKLAVATTYYGSDIKSFKIDNVDYYLLPTKSTKTYNKDLESLWENICFEFKPEIIHIHGTEFTHGLACMNACTSLNYVVSIQGMVSVYSKYYYANISRFDILKNITFRDIIRFDTLFQGKANFVKRGEFEKEYLLRTKHVIGRTSWDYAHVKAINPKVNYHFCNESLRDSFYLSEKWDIDTKSTYTIFLSQGQKPIKGLQQVLKAVEQLKSEYPTILVRIAGINITKYTNLLDKGKLSGYGSYLRNLIKKSNLKEHVQFLGTLTEEQMVIEYRNAHIFICPSSIENSPNSLGEAQLLGVPSIASYVGGVPDMVTHGETGFLYRFEEVEMLTEQIRKIFCNDNLAKKLSMNSIQVAKERHNRLFNLQSTLDIYQNIISN